MEGFEPEIRLEPEEVASLAAVMSHPGYKVIHKVCRSAVARFAVALMNADEAEEKKVLSRHRSAKVAAQFYTDITDYMNREVNDYLHLIKVAEKPLDAARDLDIGEYVGNELSDSEEESL